MPTIASTAAPAVAPILAAPPASIDSGLSGLLDSGAPAATGGVQAVAIAATPAAATALASGWNDTQSLFWTIVLVAMAIPGFLLMMLIATVLIRR